MSAQVIADISHPAHVHFYAAIGAELRRRGVVVIAVGRDKDVTNELLVDPTANSPHEARALPGTSASHSVAGQASELIRRSSLLRRLCASTGARVLLTRNPSGVLATVGTRTRSVFDTDDGTAVGAHFWLARPFANVITTGDWMPGSFGRHHRRYRGFKALAYLDPDRFIPTPLADISLGIADLRRPLVVVRFSAHAASHDRRIKGLSTDARRRLLELLEGRATVVLSTERAAGESDGEGGGTLPLRVLGGGALDPQAFLSVLAAADLCVGDSQSVAAEAAMLGVPTIRLSGFTGLAPYLGVLEHRYELMRNLSPGEEESLLLLVMEALANIDDWKARAARGRCLLLEESEDVTDWYANLVEEMLGH